MQHPRNNIKKYISILTFMILLAGIYVIGCLDYSSTEYLQDLAREPEVTAIYGPYADGYSNYLQLEFNKDMNTATVEEALSLLRRDFNSFDLLEEAAIYEWESNRQVKVSFPKLPYNVPFLCQVQTSAVTLYGERPLKTPFQQEIVIQLSDSDRPNVQSYNPQIGTAAPVNCRVMVTFDRPMDEASVITAFNVHDSGGNTISGFKQYNQVSRSLIYLPESDFTPTSSYTAVISNTAKDMNDIPMLADYSFAFQTGSNVDNDPPSVDPKTDTNNGQPRYTYTPVGVWFSEQMNLSYLPTAIKINDGSGAVSIDSYYPQADNSFWLIPTENLLPGTIYTCIIDNSAIDLAGNPITNAPYSFEFSVQQDLTPPTILSSDPNNGKINVSLSPTITVIFDKGMNKTSVESAFNL